ncbi:coiled-coil domain-containing protein 81-like [Aptenodytes patagonicus]|uniref:coiled-coil domain-containing protein 81-like n=1 Tax=Aptenodytes patagonicus TaxID=9234 RepID=UPI003FA0F340
MALGHGLQLHFPSSGVPIPTLGSFDAVPQWIQAGNEAVIIQRPVFRLARNLVVVHNLMDDKDYLPGNKELEPLKYAKVATDASVSRRKGANVALVLRNVGVLLIEGRRVEMKFYYDFLKTLSGKENLAKAVFKVPWLLDMLVSRVAPVASLSVSGRVILFPEFETELVAEPLPRPLLKTSRRVPGGDKQMRREGLPHLGQGTKVGFPGFPFPASPSLTNDEIPPFWEIRGKRRRRSSRVRQRRVIPGGSPGKKQPATGQPKGKPAPTGRAPRQS